MPGMVAHFLIDAAKKYRFAEPMANFFALDPNWNRRSDRRFTNSWRKDDMDTQIIRSFTNDCVLKIFWPRWQRVVEELYRALKGFGFINSQILSKCGY